MKLFNRPTPTPLFKTPRRLVETLLFASLTVMLFVVGADALQVQQASQSNDASAVFLAKIKYQPLQLAQR